MDSLLLISKDTVFVVGQTISNTCSCVVDWKITVIIITAIIAVTILVMFGLSHYLDYLIESKYMKWRTENMEGKIDTKNKG